MRRPCARYLVFVTLSGLVMGCEVDSSGPRWVDSLRIEPDSAHASPGSVLTFSAQPMDQHGVPMPEFGEHVQWTVRPSTTARLDTVRGAATLTVDSIGPVVLRATLGRGSRGAFVYVHPAGLNRVLAEPSELDLAVGPFVTISAVLLDAEGVPLAPADFRISWGIADATIASLSSGGSTTLGPTARVRGVGVGRTVVRLQVGDQSVFVPTVVR